MQVYLKTFTRLRWSITEYVSFENSFVWQQNTCKILTHQYFQGIIKPPKTYAKVEQDA